MIIQPQPKVIDDFLDLEFIISLEEDFLHQTPHYLNQGSIKGSPKFYVSNIDHKNYVISFIYKKVSSLIRIPTEIYRSYLNIQHIGMEGSFHYDRSDMTALLMITSTPEKGGEFEYEDESGDIKSIAYKQNRLIIFGPDKIKHRGLSNKDGSSRITLALKLNIVM